MKRRRLLVAASGSALVLGLVLMRTVPKDHSASCGVFYAGMQNPPASARAWCEAGSYFTWTSTLPVNAGFPPLNIFHACRGRPDAPAILLVHGYPTSSVDFAALAENLGHDFRVCMLDTPGHGFSDKPRAGFDYSIFDDARLVDHYLREVAHLERFSLFTHDKGDSVGLALLQRYQAEEVKPYIIHHHFITNGNVYLPLARLTRGQRALLNPASGPLVAKLLTSARLARGVTDQAFSVPLSSAEVDAYASTFAYQDGVAVQHELIEYLDERKEHEVTWLEALGRSQVPTTLIWGELDDISPLAVSDHVWAKYLQHRSTPATYWRIPCADHYLQVDEPRLVADIVRATLSHDALPRTLEGRRCPAARQD